MMTFLLEQHLNCVYIFSADASVRYFLYLIQCQCHLPRETFARGYKVFVVVVHTQIEIPKSKIENYHLPLAIANDRIVLCRLDASCILSN